MKLIASNGSCQPDGAPQQYGNHLNGNTPRPKSSTSRHGADVINLAQYRAQRRAMRVAWNILLTSVVAMAFIASAAALHREQRLQTIEAGR